MNRAYKNSYFLIVLTFSHFFAAKWGEILGSRKQTAGNQSSSFYLRIESMGLHSFT